MDPLTAWGITTGFVLGVPMVVFGRHLMLNTRHDETGVLLQSIGWGWLVVSTVFLSIGWWI